MVGEDDGPDWADIPPCCAICNSTDVTVFAGEFVCVACGYSRVADSADTAVLTSEDYE